MSRRTGAVWFALEQMPRLPPTAQPASNLGLVGINAYLKGIGWQAEPKLWSEGT